MFRLASYIWSTIVGVRRGLPVLERIKFSSDRASVTPTPPRSRQSIVQTIQARLAGPSLSHQPRPSTLVSSLYAVRNSGNHHPIAQECTFLSTFFHLRAKTVAAFLLQYNWPPHVLAGRDNCCWTGKMLEAAQPHP